MKGLKVAFATGKFGEFGVSDGAYGLPWGNPLKADMEAFKEFSRGCILVMGVKTFYSLKSNLETNGRNVMLVTDDIHRPIEPSACMYTKEIYTGNLQAYIERMIKDTGRDVCVIGGKALIEEFVPIAEKVLYTEVECPLGRVFPHDVKINMLNLAPHVDLGIDSEGNQVIKKLCPVKVTCHKINERGGIRFTITHLERIEVNPTKWWGQYGYL